MQRDDGHSPYVFLSERGGPMTPKAFHALLARIGERADLPFSVHPHMLRHGCGYALANAGHDTRAFAGVAGAQEYPAQPAYQAMNTEKTNGESTPPAITSFSPARSEA